MSTPLQEKWRGDPRFFFVTVSQKPLGNGNKSSVPEVHEFFDKGDYILGAHKRVAGEVPRGGYFEPTSGCNAVVPVSERRASCSRRPLLPIKKIVRPVRIFINSTAKTEDRHIAGLRKPKSLPRLDQMLKEKLSTSRQSPLAAHRYALTEGDSTQFCSMASSPPWLRAPGSPLSVFFERIPFPLFSEPCGTSGERSWDRPSGGKRIRDA